MGISRKTVTRPIDPFGLNDSLPRYTSIEYDTLDSVVQEILRDFPNCGIRRIKVRINVPQIMLILPSLNLYNSGTKKDIEKR